MSTRAQMRSALQRRVPRSELLAADYDKWLDDGLLDLCTRRVHIHTLERAASPITSVANQAAYSRPTNSFSILYIEDTTNARVLSRFAGGFEEYLQTKRNATTDPVPTMFTEFGSSFYVHRAPSVSTITWVPYVYVYPTLGSADTSVPDIPADWHYAVELVAAEHAFRDLGDEERAAALAQEFDRWLMMRDTTRRQTARFNVPRAGGARAHPDYARARARRF